MKRNLGSISCLLFSLLIPIYGGQAESKDKEIFNALKEKNSALLKQALNAGGDLAAKDNQNISVLHAAVLTGDASIIDYVIKRMKADNGADFLRSQLRYVLPAPVIIDTLKHDGWGDVWFSSGIWSPTGTHIFTVDNQQPRRLQMWQVGHGCVTSEELLPDYYHVVEILWNNQGLRILSNGRFSDPEITNSAGLCCQITDILGNRYGYYEKSSSYQGITMSPNGLYLLAAQDDHMGVFFINKKFDALSKFLNTESKSLAVVNKITGVQSLSWSPDSLRVLFVERLWQPMRVTYVLKVWDWKNGLIINYESNHTMNQVLWLGEGARILIQDENNVWIWNWQANIPTKLMCGGSVKLLSLCEDRSRFLSVSENDFLKLWDAAGTLLASLRIPFYVRAISLSPTGSLMLIESRNKTFRVMNASGICLSTIQLDDVNWSPEWSPDESHIFFKHQNGRVLQVWALDKGTIVTLEYNDPSWGVAWNPHGNRIITNDRVSGEIEVWDLGGTPIDWAIRSVVSGGELKILGLMLNECESLAGLCSETLLIAICFAASKVKLLQPENYENVCKAVEMLANKSGAPL